MRSTDCNIRARSGSTGKDKDLALSKLLSLHLRSYAVDAQQIPVVYVPTPETTSRQEMAKRIISIEGKSSTELDNSNRPLAQSCLHSHGAVIERLFTSLNNAVRSRIPGAIPSGRGSSAKPSKLTRNKSRRIHHR